MDRCRRFFERSVLLLAVTALLCFPAGMSTAIAADGSTAPKVIAACMVQPVYPEAERVAGIEGMVVLSVEVKSDGSVGKIVPEQEVEGHPAFTTAATTAIAKWCFEPARENGDAVDATVMIPIRFRLDKK